MYLNSTPLEIYLIIFFTMAAIGTVLALWALTSIVVQEVRHRRDAHCARTRRAWGPAHGPRPATHEHGPILH